MGGRERVRQMYNTSAEGHVPWTRDSGCKVCSKECIGVVLT